MRPPSLPAAGPAFRLRTPRPHLLALALVAMLLGAACGARQHVEPADGKRVRVRIEGNQTVKSKTLLAGLSLTRLAAAGQGFDPYLVSVDQERLRGFYLRRGHFQVQVRAHYDERADRVDVIFLVEEGPRARLARVEIAGLPDDPAVDADAIRAELGLRPGQPFSYAAYEEARPRLTVPLERAGYCRAQLESKVAADRIRVEAIIRLEYEPGSPCQFGEVRLLGIDGELADAARARVTVRAGARYSITTLERTQDALYEMGRFALVRVEPDRSGDGDVVPVTIRVTLQPRHELRLGGGFGLDPAAANVHGRTSYQIAAWPRPLTTTRLELRPALLRFREDGALAPRIESRALLERLDLLTPYLRGEAELTLAYLAVEAYTTVGPGFRLGVRYPLLRPELQLAGGWQIRYLRFRDIHPVIDEAGRAALGLDEPYRLGFFEQSLIVDLRDHPLTPRHGLYAELRAEEGSLAAGGAFRYLRLTPELRGYVGVSRAVVAARVRAGALYGDQPITERYLGGGASSHRGFPERRLSRPIRGVVDGEPRTTVVGGGALFETSAELRAPLATIRDFALGWVIFVDGGDVTTRPAELDLGHLHWAAGAGLRLGTLIGPIRFDVGYRLNRVGPGEILPSDRFAFHLSLGEAF
jgi:outer membrane protein assembly factor BamA